MRATFAPSRLTRRDQGTRAAALATLRDVYHHASGGEPVVAEDDLALSSADGIADVSADVSEQALAQIQHVVTDSTEVNERLEAAIGVCRERRRDQLASEAELEAQADATSKEAEK